MGYLKGLVRFLDRVGGLLMMGIVVVLLMQVFGRVIFKWSLPWADELARYLLITLVFLSLPVLSSEEQHIGVDYFVDRLPKRARHVVGLVREIAVGIFAVLVSYSAYSLMLRLQSARTPAMRMPVPLFYAAAFVGFALLIAVGWGNILQAARSAFRKGDSR